MDDDFDGFDRDAAPDLGAFEYIPVLRINTQQNFEINRTNYLSFEIEGSAESSQVVTVYANNTEIGQTQAGADGTWSVTGNFLTFEDGVIVMFAKSNGVTSNEVEGVLTKTDNLNAPENLRIVTN